MILVIFSGYIHFYIHFLFNNLYDIKQIVYIMRTSEDEYPKNKYPNWEDYIKRPDLKKHWPFDYENFWCVCSQAIEEMKYQLDHYKC